MKQCSKCKEWKDEREFGKRKDSKGGFRNVCEKCQSKQRKEYYIKNKKKLTKRIKKYYIKNREKTK